MTVMVMMKINSLLLLSLFLFEKRKKKNKRLFRRPRTRSKGEMDRAFSTDRSSARRVLTDVRTAVQTSHCSKNGAPDFSAFTSPKDVTFVTRSTFGTPVPWIRRRCRRRRRRRGDATCANRKRSSRPEFQKPTKTRRREILIQSVSRRVESKIFFSCTFCFFYICVFW